MDLFELRYPITDEERRISESLRSHVGVARTLLDWRLKLGLTQDQLGRRAGTKQSRVSEIEALKGNPRFDTLDRIAGVLGLMIALVPRSTLPVNLSSEYRPEIQQSVDMRASGTSSTSRWRTPLRMVG